MYIPYCPTRLFSKELLYYSLYQLMIVPTGCLVHLKNVWIHPPKREITWGLNKTQSYVFWMTNWVLPASMNILAQWKINKQIKWNYFYPYHVFDDLMSSGPCCCCEILYRRSLLHDRWLLRLAYHIELVRPRLWKLPWVEVNHVCRMCDWLTPFVPKLNNGISFQSGC